ncbi:MAG: hypothetical protein Q9Q40_10860 [Acidobacteriota bacterium]|nr:hypothetical protein [Acidobacteriota bacterium]
MPLLPRRLLSLLVALLALLGGAGGRTLAEGAAGDGVEGGLIGGDVEVAASLLSRIEARWWRLKALEDARDLQGAAEAGEELLSFLRDEGVERLEPMAAAVLAEGYRHLERGELAMAVQHFRFARRLDPRQAGAWWAEALANREKGQWSRALSLGWRALTTRWHSFWTLFGDAVNLTGALWAALLLSGVLSLIVLLLRHGPELVREVDSHLPPHWHPRWRSTVGWTLLLSPLAMLVIGIWSLFFWAVALVPACRPAERRWIYAFLLLLALTPPVVGGLWLLTGVAASPTAQVAVASVESSLRPDLLIRLARLAEEDPREATWKLLLARLLAPRYPNRAVPLLRQAAKLDPDDARIRIALGNVLYRVGKYEAAGVHYRQAREIDRESVLALFNQWKARLATFDFDKANECLLEANRLDRKEVARLEARTREDDVADPTFTVTEVARQVLADELRPGLRKAMRPGSPMTLAALAALLGAFVLRFRSGRLEIRRCETCGKAASLRSGEMTANGLCLACSQLLSRREGLAPSAREEQTRRIDRYLVRVRRGRHALHLFAPGLALVHEGRVWIGWAMFSAWCFLLIAGLRPGLLLPLQPESVLWRPGGLYLVAALGLWIVCQLPGARPRPPAGRGGR